MTRDSVVGWASPAESPDATPAEIDRLDVLVVPGGATARRGTGSRDGLRGIGVFGA